MASKDGASKDGSSKDSRFTVVIFGGSGAFGSRIAERLAQRGDADLILAGRTRGPLEAVAATLREATGQHVRIAVLDAGTVGARDVVETGAGLVINASGPFQSAHYGLADAAIAASAHYIDLADSRAFVTGIGRLDEAARRKDVLVVSGASSVPGLSSAVVARHRDDFASLDSLDIAISPGNSFDPGVATVASVLGGVGQPMQMLIGGRWRTVRGWHGLNRRSFDEAGGEVGRRWLGFVDVPDLALFPAHDPGLTTVRFQAGLEVSAFHLGLWAASWLVRSGLVASLDPLAGALLAVKRRLSWLGSDRGGMRIDLRGTGRDGKPKTLTWLLVAKSGHGPYVPALASLALARRLITGAETQRGAHPCFGLVGLDDMLDEAQGLDIACRTNEKPLPL